MRFENGMTGWGATGLVDKAVYEREDPGALALEVSEGGAQEVTVPDPLVVEGGERTRGCDRGGRGEVVLERVREVVRAAVLSRLSGWQGDERGGRIIT